MSTAWIRAGGLSGPVSTPAAGEENPGPDRANASATEGMRPVGPRSTFVRPWETIPGNAAPTDAETLAEWERLAAAGDWQATRDAAALRERAARGYHDGSLPHLGPFRPTYVVPAATASAATASAATASAEVDSVSPPAADDSTFCPFTDDGQHVWEINDEDGPAYDYCEHCRIYRHETQEGSRS